MTSNHIKMNGYPFIDMLELTIRTAANEHPYACVKGHIAQEDCQKLLHQTAADDRIVITANDYQGQEHILFSGILDDFSCSTVNEVSTIAVKGLGNSTRCDIVKEIRVFQNAGTSYEEMCGCLKSAQQAGLAQLSLQTIPYRY